LKLFFDLYFRDKETNDHVAQKKHDLVNMKKGSIN